MPRAMTSRSIFANQLGFMSGQVVEDDMNLPAGAQGDDLFEESDEVAAGVAGCRLAVHAPRLGVQCGIQRKGAMPVVLEAMTLGASGRERENRVEPIQSLDRRLLIDAEHGCMLRRIQIQTENVGRFAFELGIVAGQVTLQTVGFETSFLPDSMDGVFADSQSGRQFATAPMRRSIARLLAGGRQNPGSQGRS